jgi:maleylpyruvate isomerase
MTNLATWAVTGQETPAYASREQRDADIEAAARRTAAELASDLEQANARLLAAFRALKDGTGWNAADAVLRRGPRALAARPPHHRADRPPRRPRHHLGVARGRPRRDPGRDRGLRAQAAAHPESPGLRIVAGEGEEWTVGDGSYRIEGY